MRYHLRIQLLGIAAMLASQACMASSLTLSVVQDPNSDLVQSWVTKTGASDLF
jgi:hypothetical protein